MSNGRPKRTNTSKYPYASGRSFKTNRQTGKKFPTGAVVPTIRNVDIDAAMTRINERFKVTQAYARQIAEIETLTDLAAIQQMVIESPFLDPYDKKVLVETVIDKKFEELMRAAGR